jgi:hypothetical protein
VVVVVVVVVAVILAVLVLVIVNILICRLLHNQTLSSDISTDCNFSNVGYSKIILK